MTEVNGRRKVHVIASHSRQERLTDVYFIWDLTQPGETYAISPSHRLTIIFDTFFPVLPEKVTIREPVELPDYQIAAQLFGEDFLELISTSKKSGIALAGLELHRCHRETIAKLQLASPSTPQHLGRAASLLVTYY